MKTAEKPFNETCGETPLAQHDRPFCALSAEPSVGPVALAEELVGVGFSCLSVTGYRHHRSGRSSDPRGQGWRVG
jgi:hypothetical protein